MIVYKLHVIIISSPISIAIILIIRGPSEELSEDRCYLKISELREHYLLGICNIAKSVRLTP